MALGVSARRKTRGLVFASGGMLLVLATLGWHRVDNSLTAEDRAYIPKYISAVSPVSGSSRSFQEEIEVIRGVQQAVLKVAAGNEGLPLNAGREPRDLFEARTGLCYDRSRVIEKILRYAGFSVRHVSIYSTSETGSALKSLLTAGVASHAVSEVRTTKGWLVVDSNDPWISLDVAMAPVDIRTMSAAAERRRQLRWQAPVPTPIYEEPFAVVYGLYSRHGRFYKPYGFIPDINYSEFAQNLR